MQIRNTMYSQANDQYIHRRKRGEIEKVGTLGLDLVAASFLNFE